MKWYTCVIHIEHHISPVQWFHTRAENTADAERNALAWINDGDPDWDSEQVDIPLIFEGRINPVNHNAAKGSVE
jgi:hypothetical protein